MADIIRKYNITSYESAIRVSAGTSEFTNTGTEPITLTILSSGSEQNLLPGAKINFTFVGITVLSAVCMDSSILSVKEDINKSDLNDYVAPNSSTTASESLIPQVDLEDVSGTFGVSFINTNHVKMRLTGNASPLFLAGVANRVYLLVEQDDTGGHEVTWPAFNGPEPVIDTAADAKTIIGLYFDGQEFHTQSN